MAKTLIKDFRTVGLYLGKFEDTGGEIKNGLSVKIIIAPLDDETGNVDLTKKVELDVGAETTVDDTKQWFLIEPTTEINSSPLVLGVKIQPASDK